MIVKHGVAGGRGETVNQTTSLSWRHLRSEGRIRKETNNHVDTGAGDGAGVVSGRVTGGCTSACVCAHAREHRSFVDLFF